MTLPTTVNRFELKLPPPAIPRIDYYGDQASLGMNLHAMDKTPY
jgi:hypothetical protein